MPLVCLLAFVLVFYSFNSLPLPLHFVPFLKRGRTELKNGDFVPMCKTIPMKGSGGLGRLAASLSVLGYGRRSVSRAPAPVSSRQQARPRLLWNSVIRSG